MHLIQRNPEEPPSPRRILLKVLSGIGRVLLVSALVAFALGLVLLVAWWQVLAIPYRRLQPESRLAARKEAIVALLAAAGAAYAAFRTAEH